MNNVLSNKKTVAVSGGFDPIHIGHIRLFQEARNLGGKLVVILNNDNWLQKKKGYTFMPQEERKEILEALENIDEVFISRHPKNPGDMSIVSELREIKPDIFANGGDRSKSGQTEENIAELEICKLIECETVFNVGRGGKVQSSSQLIKEVNKDKRE